jgi:lysophospholipase L1-like esterase
LLGAWVRSSQQAIVASTPSLPEPTPNTQKSITAQLPNLSLNKPRAKGNGSFNSAGFTQPGETGMGDPGPDAQFGTTPLPASSLQAKAETIIGRGLAYPSFNSRQFDSQVALYQKYLELNGAPDVLIVGSSRALRGIDPLALKAALADQGYPGLKIFNFGINGATTQVVDLIIRQVLPQDKLPKLILFADGARAFNSGRRDITYNGIVASEGYQTLLAGTPPIPGATGIGTADRALQPSDQTPVASGETATLVDRYRQINEVLNQQLASISTIYSQRDRLLTKLKTQLATLLPSHFSASEEMMATSDSLINSSPVASAATTATGPGADFQSLLDINGFLPLSVQFNPTTYYQKYARVSGDYDSDYESFNLQGGQTEALVALAQYAKTHQVPLVFVNLPLTREYLDPVRKRHEEAFQQHMLQLAPQIGLTYRDLSGALSTRPSYFSDPSHLNRYGAYEVSRRLAQDVMIPWQRTK